MLRRWALCRGQSGKFAALESQAGGVAHVAGPVLFPTFSNSGQFKHPPERRATSCRQYHL